MRLFVTNLPFDASRDDVVDLFGRYGRITRVKLPVDPVTRRPLGFAVVVFWDRKDARRAARELQGFLVGDRMIRIDKRRRREQRSRGQPRTL